MSEPFVVRPSFSHINTHPIDSAIMDDAAILNTRSNCPEHLEIQILCIKVLRGQNSPMSCNAGLFSSGFTQRTSLFFKQVYMHTYVYERSISAIQALRGKKERKKKTLSALERINFRRLEFQMSERRQARGIKGWHNVRNSFLQPAVVA